MSRHLEELDEDLMLDLDDVARDIQQSQSMISRTGQLEEDLLKRHPDLQARIDLERQAKIDSIMILNKHSEAGQRGASSFKAGSFHENPQSPTVASKGRRRSSNNVGPATTKMATGNLKGESSNADLMFYMDADDKGVRLLSTSAKAKDLPSDFKNSPEPWTLASPQKNSTKSWIPSHDDNVHSPQSERDLPQFSPLPTRSPAAISRSTSGSQAPWVVTDSLPTSKLAMRDIIDQASSSRTSNLTIGLTVGQDKKSSSSPASNNKLSQKERKKLQHQAMQNFSVEASTPSPSPATSSPWKAIPKSKSLPAERPAPVQFPSSGPQLTMRQTIANPDGGKKNANISKSGVTAGDSSKALRIPSSEITPRKASPGRSVSASRASPMTLATPLQPHSIRHIPKPIRDLTLPENISMVEILNQQYSDKFIGTHEKRSITEIQQQQEFEEWFEAESVRLQTAEAARLAPNKHKRDGRHRNGRGTGKKSGKSLQPQPNSQAEEASQTSRR